MAPAGIFPTLSRFTLHLLPRKLDVFVGAEEANRQAAPAADRRTCSRPHLQHAAWSREESREDVMAESVYKIIEIVGTSPTSWEKAAAAAVQRASSTLRDLRIAEVSQQDLVIGDGKVEAYRVRLKISFKYEE